MIEAFMEIERFGVAEADETTEQIAKETRTKSRKEKRKRTNAEEAT
jgi:hypothetical protein